MRTLKILEHGEVIRVDASSTRENYRGITIFYKERDKPFYWGAMLGDPKMYNFYSTKKDAKLAIDNELRRRIKTDA